MSSNYANISRWNDVVSARKMSLFSEIMRGSCLAVRVNCNAAIVDVM